MDYGAVVKNTVTLWTRDGKTHKLMLFYLLGAIVFYALVIGLMFFIFKDVFLQAMSLSQSGGTATNSFDRVSSIITAFISNFIVFMIVFVPVMIVAMLVFYYLWFSMSTRALEVLGFSTVPFTFNKFLKLIGLYIWVVIAALVSWYNRKFMYIFIGLVVFTVFATLLSIFVPIIGVFLIVLAVILWIAYAIIMVYNSIRLSMAWVIFLQKDAPIRDVVREGWEFTKGKALDIFVVTIVVSIVLFIIQFVVAIPIWIIRFVLQFATQNEIVGFGAEAILNILLAPVWVAMYAYMAPSVFAELMKAPVAAPAQVAPPAPEAPVPSTPMETGTPEPRQRTRVPARAKKR